MLLQSTDGSSVSLVWFAGTAFSIALILIGVVWLMQIAQQEKQLQEQKKTNEIIQQVAIDIAVMKTNSTNTAQDVKQIRDDLDETRDELGKIDKRIFKLEIAK